MREGGSPSSSGTHVSLPLLKGVGAEEVGAEVKQAWGYVLSFQTTGSTPAADTSASPTKNKINQKDTTKQKAAAPTSRKEGGLQLTIEAAGKGSVIVAVRPK